jgi:UDP-glucuronate 4-epimerase
MKILITGGAGFIGSHLSERLLNEGLSVICLDNFDSYYSPRVKSRNVKDLLNRNNFVLIKGDIRNGRLLKRLFQTSSIDKVVHMAAKVGVRASIQDPLSYEDVKRARPLQYSLC